MPHDPSSELTPAQLDAAQKHMAARIDALTEEDLRALASDPEAFVDFKQSVASEAHLAAAMQVMTVDEQLEVSKSVYESLHGPLFTDAEWALIFAQPGSRHLATNEAERNKFEHLLRQDPAGVQSMKRAMADVLAERKATSSPRARQWILLIAFGLVVAIIAITLSRNVSSTPTQASPKAQVVAPSATPDPTQTPRPSLTAVPSRAAAPRPVPTPDGLLTMGTTHEHTSDFFSYKVRLVKAQRFPWSCRDRRPPLTTNEEIVEVTVRFTGGNGAGIGFSTPSSRDFRLEDTSGRTYEDSFGACPPYQGQLWPILREGDVLTAYLYFAARRGRVAWLTYTDDGQVARWAIP